MLWDTVRRLADDVGTRVPDEIRIVPEVNAAVVEESQLLGLHAGRRYLYLGIPLLQGLSVAQLQAVIAHELGHYSGRHGQIHGCQIRDAPLLLDPAAEQALAWRLARRLAASSTRGGAGAPASLALPLDREGIRMTVQTADAQVTLSLPVLRKGQHEGEPPVERLQSMLNFVKGVNELAVDGIFGPKTEAAVRAFQSDENLAVDGIVGRYTWAALLRRWLLFSQPG